MIHVPKCEYAEYGSNLQATPSSTVPGTSIAVGATPHTKTAYTSLIDPIPGDCYGFWLLWLNTGSATAINRALLDLALSESGVGAADSGIILPNYLVGGGPTISQAGGGATMMFIPIFLPEGKRLSARWQSAVASITGVFAVFLNRCSPSGVPDKVWSKADALGITTASSSGVAITAGNTGTESAWTSIGSATSRDYEAFIPAVQGATDTAMASISYHAEFGAGSTPWAEYYFATRSEENVCGLKPPVPIYHGAPAGTQMQARAEASSTGEVLDYALYGLY